MNEENPYAPPAGETKVTLVSEGGGGAELSRKVGWMQFMAHACIWATVLAGLGFVMSRMPYSENSLRWTVAAGILLMVLGIVVRIRAWRLKARLVQQGHWNPRLALEEFRHGVRSIVFGLLGCLLVLLAGKWVWNFFGV
jgi:hypothetical protein